MQENTVIVWSLDRVNDKKPCRTKQACKHCRKMKAKCSGGYPCERCKEKGLKCEYHNSKSKKVDDKQLKEKSKHIQAEIKNQKQMANHWKHMYNQLMQGHLVTQIVQKGEYDNICITVDGLEQPISNVSFTIDQKTLDLLNYLLLNFERVDMPISTMKLDEANADWSYLSTQLLTVNDLEKYDVSHVIHLWGRCILFMVPSILNGLDYQEYTLWGNIMTMLKYVMFSCKTLDPLCLTQVVNNLFLTAKRYIILGNIGASSSCLLLAYRLAIDNKGAVSARSLEFVIVDLLMNATSRSERKKWINTIEDKRAQNPVCSIRYNVAYCLSLLRVTKDLTYDEYDDLSLRLQELNQLAENIEAEETKLIIKCQERSIRSEIAYRMGYYDLGRRWLDSCIASISDVEDASSIHCMITTRLLYHQNFVRVVIVDGEPPTTIADELARVLMKKNAIEPPKNPPSCFVYAMSSKMIQSRILKIRS